MLIQYGPTAFFYLIALAASLSGYTNVKVALGLIVVGTLWLLIFSARKIWERITRVEPWHLVLIGVVGATFAGGMALGGIIWQHYRDIPQSVLPAPLSVEERQFRVDLQKFVISNIDDMVMKYERVLHVMMKTIHHGPGDLDEPLAVLATDAFNYTVMSEWGKLRAQATTAINQPDISSLILEIRNLFGVYQGSQKYITLFAAGSRIVVASMPETADWIAADARCQNALRDLQASPLGKDLKNIPVEVFASNRGMFNKGR